MKRSSSRVSFSLSPLSTRTKLQKSSVRKKVSFKHLAEAIERNPCAICLNRIDHEKAAVITQCMHAYCVDCIHKWSNINRKCPLCKLKFDSWSTCDFSKHGVKELVNLKSEDVRRRTFSGSDVNILIHRLPPLDVVINEYSNTTPYDPVNLTWSYGVNLARSYGVNSVRRRNQEQPRRARWFGDARTVAPEIIKERIKRWRKSIYDEQLQAVPLETPLEITDDIEDWLFRELQAVTGIPDPTLIVYMIIPIYENFEDKKRMGIPVEEEEYLGPLRGFLFEHARLFWHELTCFAQSGYSMMAYDITVVYIPMGTTSTIN
ncbi:uncharacterized protein LOC141666055 [Apium graveolens]|uniref:uncharacterized protein LOC141666055 n=1 Tax=Apium graveolens TaxID=4045 RepID=UPI003D79D64E